MKLARWISLVVLVVLLIMAGTAAFAEPQASRGTFLTLMRVQEMWEEEKYDEAMLELDELIADTRDKPYDNALANQYLAQTAILGDREDRVRPALEAALSLPDLPEQMEADLKLFYGQVVLGNEEWELARRMLTEWLAVTEDTPSPPQLFSTAYANFMTGRHAEAEPLVARAIEESRKPNQSWYRLHYEIFMELKRFDEAEAILLGLLAEKPDDEGYWRLLANHHLRLENNRKALAALTIAHQQGLLSSKSDLSQIVSLYGYAETPERAARLLASMVEDAVVDGDFDTLRHLGNLWLLSREREKAIVSLEQAAKVAPDGKTHELLASLYFEDEKWQLAHDRFRQAKQKGGIDNTDRLSLLAGISAFRAGMIEEARTSLREAEKSDELRSQARSVLRQLDDA